MDTGSSNAFAYEGTGFKEAQDTKVEKQQSQVGQLIGLHQRFQEIEKLWEEDLKRVVTRRKILDFSF
nr:hypothetical protein Iba_chr03bCG1080 [Ipomoea batatas]